MTTHASPVEARRFLHCCYCCDNADASTRFFEAGLGLELRMRSAGERVDGSQMGFTGGVETDARFLYDQRGPRTSSAVEVQEWIDPPPIGEPYAAPNDIGFQALGVGVAALDEAVDRLIELGARVVGRSSGSPAIIGTTTARTLCDPTGVTIDLVEAPELDGASQLAHIRGTCSDLDRSLDWYTALGFEVLVTERDVQIPEGTLGLPGAATASFARLRLPDEPFALVLVEWHEPRSQGRPYESGNHRGLYRFAIAVDDARAAYDALSRRWDLSSPPQSVELGGTKVPPMWIAFLSDPDGLVIEMVERPRSAFR